MTKEKKSAIQKIFVCLTNLSKVSVKQSRVDEMVAKTDNEELKAFIIEAETERVARYQADIKYLRGQILYQTAKHVENLNVRDFQNFGENLHKMLSGEYDLVKVGTYVVE